MNWLSWLRREIILAVDSDSNFNQSFAPYLQQTGGELIQARRTLIPGQKGTKKFLERYGERLVCVRYRYDEQRRKRFTTIEIIIDESEWSPPENPDIVGLRVEFQETELQRRIKQAGGKWNSTKRVWEIQYDRAIALGLKKRIVKLKVSNIRHPKVSNIGH